MTYQVRDRLRVHDNDFSIEGVSGGRLLNLDAFGLYPKSIASFCWRGFRAEYAIRESRLILVNLYVNLLTVSREYVAGPTINGVEPVGDAKRRSAFNNVYLSLNYAMNYSGTVLVVGGSVERPYDHKAFHAAWYCDKVIEIVLEHGMLTDEFDRSDQVGRIRESYLGKLESGTPDSSLWRDFNRDVTQALSREYSHAQ